MAGRARSERRQAVLRRLDGDPNVWVATASPDGRPHLVPLSLAWDGTDVIVTTPTASPTVRNARAQPAVRLALDSAEDVVIIEATATVVPIGDVEAGVLDRYAQRVGWDPRHQTSPDWSMLLLRPRVVQTWNGPAEIEGRTVMRDGVWLP